MAVASISAARPVPVVGGLRAALARLARVLALAAPVALLALLPRLAEIERPITADEPVWFERTTQFAAAVVQRHWAGTEQTGHPGVTTMWLGTLGMGPGRAAALDGARLDLLAPDKAAAFVAARRALAVAAALLVALVAVLAARGFGATVGVLAGLLLALDPWLVGHTRILH